MLDCCPGLLEWLALLFDLIWYSLVKKLGVDDIIAVHDVRKKLRRVVNFVHSILHKHHANPTISLQ